MLTLEDKQWLFKLAMCIVGMIDEQQRNSELSEDRMIEMADEYGLDI